jgi:hypothetical protein
MKANFEARLRKIEDSLPEAQTVYRFAASAADAERIKAECDARGERVVIIRWQEPGEQGAAQ